ncbi:hypothetical protein HQ571_06020 [Candidatus Kuenenbacteria bacterium]|nr:hypothetical protein [Candidatus Kuenenbacteria bacterium]
MTENKKELKRLTFWTILLICSSFFMLDVCLIIYNSRPVIVNKTVTFYLLMAPLGLTALGMFIDFYFIQTETLDSMLKRMRIYIVAISMYVLFLFFLFELLAVAHHWAYFVPLFVMAAVMFADSNRTQYQAEPTLED